LAEPSPTMTTQRAGSERVEETVVSVERAFAIVAMLADAEDGLSLAEIARRLDLNKAIAVKLLNTLERLALVWRDDRARRFYLTYSISNLGLRQLQKSRLLDQCSAVLKSLAEESGELVRLAVVEHGQRITWVLAIAGAKRSLQIDPNYTLEIGLQTHAAGKAWLSTMPFDRALKLMLQQGIRQLTPYSKVAIGEIRADLEAAARRGFASSYEENELGVGAVASPILAPTLNGELECVGTVSLAAPTNRMNRADLEACGSLVVAAAARLASIWPLEARARSGSFKGRS
jgi:IclR family transcriptional regulator, acetate operon repressor